MKKAGRRTKNLGRYDGLTPAMTGTKWRIAFERTRMTRQRFTLSSEAIPRTCGAASSSEALSPLDNGWRGKLFQISQKYQGAQMEGR